MRQLCVQGCGEKGWISQPVCLLSHALVTSTHLILVWQVKLSYQPLPNHRTTVGPCSTFCIPPSVVLPRKAVEGGRAHAASCCFRSLSLQSLEILLGWPALTYPRKLSTLLQYSQSRRSFLPVPDAVPGRRECPLSVASSDLRVFSSCSKVWLLVGLMWPASWT